MNKVIERRLEFLKLEAKGVSLCEIVNDLSKKYRTSERNIYYDSETRKTWQPLLSKLFDLDKALLIAVNRYEWLYREAAFQYETATQQYKPTWWSHMLNAASKIVELQGITPMQIAESQRKIDVFYENTIPELVESYYALAEAYTKNEKLKPVQR